MINTLPKILKANGERYGNRVAMRKKALGIWREYTWSEVYQNVQALACGLAYLGLRRGDKLVILGANDPQWYWAEYATQACGGTAMVISANCRGKELASLIQACPATIAIVQGQEQVDSLADIKHRIPHLDKIVYWVDVGLQDAGDASLISLVEVQNIGRSRSASNPAFFENEILFGNADDDAVICCMQKTDEVARSTIALTHRYLLTHQRLFAQVDLWRNDAIFMSAGAPVEALDQIVALANPLVNAVSISFAEAADTFANDLRDMAPDHVYFPAAYWERIVTTIQMNMARSSWFKKVLYDASIATAESVRDRGLQTKRLNVSYRLARKLANLAVLGSLRRQLGLDCCLSAYEGGDFLAHDFHEYLHRLGIPVRQLFADPRCGLIAMHRGDCVRAGTVGPPLQSDALWFDAAGRIRHVVSTGAQLQQPSSSAAQSADVYTERRGYLDDDGHLVILGKEDALFTMPDGTLGSLERVEAKLRLNPMIDQAVAFGDAGGLLSAIVCINYAGVGEWAKRHRVKYSSFRELAQHPEVYELIESLIEAVNRELKPTLRIWRFANLHKSLDVDQGALTGAGHLNRSEVYRHYQGLIAAICAGEACYRDENGRRGDAGIAHPAVDIVIRSVAIQRERSTTISKAPSFFGR